jgi:hypothetical protein
MGAELFQMDGQTDRQTHGEADSRFHNFANAPKMVAWRGNLIGRILCCSRFSNSVAD